MAEPAQVRLGDLCGIQLQIFRDLLHETARIDQSGQTREILRFNGAQVVIGNFGVLYDLFQLDTLRFADFSQELTGELGLGVQLASELLLEHGALGEQRRVQHHVALGLGRLVIRESGHVVGAAA